MAQGVFWYIICWNIMDTRQKDLGFAVLSILLVLLLAGSLSVLELRGGNLGPFARVELSGQEGGFTSLFWGEVIFRCLMAFFIFALILFPFYLITMLRTREGRKKLLLNVIQIAALLLVVQLMYEAYQNMGEIEPVEETPPVVEYEGSILPEAPEGPAEGEAEPPSVPRWAAWIAAGAFAFAAAAGAAFFLRQRYKKPEFLPLDRLADEAQQALDSIRAGDDVRDVIIRCYLAMSEVLEKERRISRQSFMTPREFEHVLAEKGLPRAPVRQLTGLFEKVRYGGEKPARREEDLAVLSLSEIVQHCRGGAS